MAIPSYEDMMLPVLKLISDGAETIPACEPHLAKHFGLSEEEREELLPSGKQRVLANRAHWARHYMAQAKLVEPIKRGHFQLTDAGRELLARNPSALDREALKVYPEFRDFMSRSKAKDDDSRTESGSTEPESSKLDTATPEDRMAQASAEMDLALTEELLEATLALSPPRFERLILDLLRAMGYGGGHDTMYRETPVSGDGGIDGIINEDTLGLDAVYIQAKRYAPDAGVGEPAIRDFIGALTSVGATKGVFVTTSSFSRPARDIVGRIQQRIVLIDGQRLARLMIEHDVGVRPRKTYVIRTVDEDYFSDS